MTNEGFFGIPIHVSANYLVLFILFGALAEKSGLGKLIIDLSLLVIYKYWWISKNFLYSKWSFWLHIPQFCCKCYDNRYFYYPINEKNNYPEGFPEGVESVASTGGQLLHLLWVRLHLLWLNF